MGGATVVGRDGVLEASWQALQSTGRVLLEGPAGIGKTSILHALVDRAHDLGMRVLRCAPTETEAALPLVALADLLAPLSDDVDGLPTPQAGAVRAALLLGDPDDTVDDRALAAATRSLLDTAAHRSGIGLLLAIDDAPWLDPPSERALRFALRRTSDRVRVVVTRRGTDDAPLPLGLDGVDVERVLVAPLGVGPLHHLLRQRFGVSLSRPTVVRLAHDAGGNPLLAIELTRAVLRLAQLPGPGDDLPVAASMQDLVDASLATLDADGVRAVRLTALLSAPHVTDLIAAGIPAAALDAIEEVGLARAGEGGRVRFVHPAYTTAIRASIPAGVRRRMHEQLADASSDPDERARQLAQCTSVPSAEVAGELADAAGRARARGAPELAAELYERASELSPDIVHATALRLRALHCVFDCGDYVRAADQADALGATLRGDSLAEALLLRAAIAFSADDLPLAEATGTRALDAVTPGSRLAGRIHAHMAVFVDVPRAARDHAEVALRLLPETGDVDPRETTVLGRSDRAVLASALMLMFLNEVRSGMPVRSEVLERALDLEAGEPSWLAGNVPAIWWKGIDEHDRARERLLDMLEHAAASGDEPLQHELMQHLAEADTLAGRYADAGAWIARARELAQQLGAGVAAEHWLAGTLAAHRGDLDAARAAGERGVQEAARTGDPWLRRINLQLSAFAALGSGHAADAARWYAELADAMDATGLVEPLTARFEPDWIEAALGVGDLDTAAAALERLERRHDLLPRPWTRLARARSQVLIASARGQDTEALIEDLLATRASVPEDVVPFDRARCLLVAGLAHRRARRKLAARDALLAAAAEFDAIDARSFAARARAEADRTGTRAASTQQLTPSELRVAQLAAGGATNREIAEALFISPKTVEANLARVYRKLDISRRTALAAALATEVGART